MNNFSYVSWNSFRADRTVLSHRLPEFRWKAAPSSARKAVPHGCWSQIKGLSRPPHRLLRCRSSLRLCHCDIFRDRLRLLCRTDPSCIKCGFPTQASDKQHHCRKKANTYRPFHNVLPFSAISICQFFPFYSINAKDASSARVLQAFCLSGSAGFPARSVP